MTSRDNKANTNTNPQKIVCVIQSRVRRLNTTHGAISSTFYCRKATKKQSLRQTLIWNKTPNYKPSTRRICRCELERNTIYAMTFIRWCTKSFAFKNMAEMPTASCACNFNPPTIWVRLRKQDNAICCKNSINREEKL